MYLQLADNGTDYTPVETNQGILMVRNDMLSEDITLSQKGKLIAKAAPIIAKAAPLIAKGAIGANPAGAAALIASKALPIAKQAAAAVKAQRTAAGKPPIIKTVGSGLKKLISKAPSSAIIPAAAGAAAAAGSEQGSMTASNQAADIGVIVEKQSFLRKYRTPLFIAGGVLAVGTLIYVLTRKRK